MKLMIASDLHGSAAWTRRLLREYHRIQPNRLVLLGDLLYHGPRNDLPEEYAPKTVIPMLNAIKDDILAVRGNCEAEVDQMVLEFPVMADYAQMILEDGRTLFLTHGHLFDPDRLPPLKKGSVFAFGHVHVKHGEWKGDIAVINPGSVSIPKDGTHSYMLYENGVFTAWDLATGQQLLEFDLNAGR